MRMPARDAKPIGAKLMGTAAAAAMMLAVGQSAMAHPHVQVKVRTQLLHEGGAVVGLHHIWVMDEAWLASQLEEHDRNNDGRLSAEELVPVIAESKATLEMFKSFTTVRQGGNRIRPGAPQDLTIDYYGQLLGMSFVVLLDKPVPLLVGTPNDASKQAVAGKQGAAQHSPGLLLEVYDATYFSSFAFAGDSSVVFAGEPPAGCTIKVGVAASVQQMSAYKMVARQLGQEFSAKAVVPQAVAVSCTNPLRPGSASLEAVGLAPASGR